MIYKNYFMMKLKKLSHIMKIAKSLRKKRKVVIKTASKLYDMVYGV